MSRPRPGRQAHLRTVGKHLLTPGLRRTPEPFSTRLLLQPTQHQVVPARELQPAEHASTVVPVGDPAFTGEQLGLTEPPFVARRLHPARLPENGGRGERPADPSVHRARQRTWTCPHHLSRRPPRDPPAHPDRSHDPERHAIRCRLVSDGQWLGRTEPRRERAAAVVGSATALVDDVEEPEAGRAR